MKQSLISRVQKISAVACLAIFLSTTLVPVPAHAALSEKAKEYLNGALSEASAGDLMEMVTYLYNTYYGGTIKPVVTTPVVVTDTPVSNTKLCTYAVALTKDLRRDTVDDQVITLQKLLNALAKSNPSYLAVRATGEGSYGNEISLFGPGTVSALGTWQKKHMGNSIWSSNYGVLDSTTRTNIEKVYCGKYYGAASNNSPVISKEEYTKQNQVENDNL